jgi:hypothetical protein
LHRAVEAFTEVQQILVPFLQFLRRFLRKQWKVLENSGKQRAISLFCRPSSHPRDRISAEYAMLFAENFPQKHNQNPAMAGFGVW